MHRKKVLLVYLSLIHYRKSLFQRLADEDSIDFLIAAGKESPYEGILNFDPIDSNIQVHYLENRNVLGRKRGLIWQKGLFSIYKDFRPDYIIYLGPNLHILSSLLLFLLLQPRKVKQYWWGHATFGNQGKIGKAIRRYFFKRADKTLTYDQRGADRLLAEGIEKEKIKVIWNCINSESYRSKLTKKSQEVYKLAYVGRIYKGKKVEILLDLARIMKRDNKFSFLLTIVGDGQDLSVLRKRAIEYKVEDVVKFTGALYGNDVNLILKNCHVGIIPALVGLSVIDFIGKGIPVVTENSNLHGPEISAVKDGLTGKLYESDNPRSLTEAVYFILRDCERYSQNCLDLAWKDWHPKCVSEQIIESL